MFYRAFNPKGSRFKYKAGCRYAKHDKDIPLGPLFVNNSEFINIARAIRESTNLGDLSKCKVKIEYPPWKSYEVPQECIGYLARKYREKHAKLGVGAF